MNVGIRELKEHLSEYLERAARGEVIQVTDRGQPKAILGPLPDVSLLEEGVAGGWIRAPQIDQPARRVPRHAARASTASALADDRGD
jgi:prevent-host-death family protein